MVNLTSTFVEKVPTESHTVDNVIALVSKIDTLFLKVQKEPQF